MLLSRWLVIEEATNGEWIGEADQRRTIEHAICRLSFALVLLGE